MLELNFLEASVILLWFAGAYLSITKFVTRRTTRNLLRVLIVVLLPLFGVAYALCRAVGRFARPIIARFARSQATNAPLAH